MKKILNEVEDYQSANKIAGKLIASGRANFVEYAPKKFGYVFQDNYGFNWRVDPRSLEVDGITQDQLLDCVEQLEEMGSFEELRKKFPSPTDLRFYGGFLNSGCVVTSRKNPLITMSVTFHSSDRGDSPDIQVGWFFDEHRDLAPNKMDNLKIVSVGEPHQDVRGDKPIDAHVESAEPEGDMLLEDVVARVDKPNQVVGKILWFHKSQGKGVVEADNKKQYYFDLSLITEDVEEFTPNTLVKFIPKYIRESSVWVADDLELFADELPRSLMEEDDDLENEPDVSISSYMQSRRYNHKLYARLVEKLEEIHKKYAPKVPGLKIEISMSAKHQTPYIILKAPGIVELPIGGLENAVEQALDDVGFTSQGSEEYDNDGYIINFRDEY